MKYRGFTLIELLAVVLIVGILTAVAVPQYKKSLERSRLTEATQMLPAIFDSRTRLMVEGGYSMRELLEDDPEAMKEKLQGELPFTRLDIEMKGHISKDSAIKWETDNFTYYLFSFGEEHKLTEEVSARAKRGYEGITLYYDGSVWACCDPEHEGGSEENRCENVAIFNRDNRLFYEPERCAEKE